MEHDEATQADQELPRLSWQTTAVARSLGMRPGALRKLCERRAVRRADGTMVVTLEHGIVGEKRGGRARWRFLVPRPLIRSTEADRSER